MTKEVRNLFELVPRRTRAFEEREDGTVDVLIPRYGDNVVGRLLRHVLTRRPVRIHLDDVGASVWRLCDGCRTVQEIGQSMHRQFGERIEPVFDRLEVFLRQMKKAGLIEWTN